MTRLCLLLTSLALATMPACTSSPTPGAGGAGGQGAGGGQPQVDDCVEPYSAALGRCELAVSGDECTGVPDEERVFVALEEGDPVNIVVGPQSASMFVLGLQTTGMHPGDPNDPASQDNPDVAIDLRDDTGETLALYHGRPAFKQNADEPTLLEAAGLFVIVDGSGSKLVGDKLTALAEVHDRDGVTKCSKVTFTAALTN